MLTGHGVVNSIKNGRKNAISKIAGSKLTSTNCLIIMNSLFICLATVGMPLRLISTVTQDKHVQIAPKFH